MLSAFLVVPASTEVAHRPRAGLRQLAHETFVTYNPGTIHHELQRRALARSGAVPTRVISASTTEAILGLVAAGVGCSLVPSIDQASLNRSGNAVFFVAAREPVSPAKARRLRVRRAARSPGACARGRRTR
jgi:DNA-binding transcriptional LysR family regulator